MAIAVTFEISTKPQATSIFRSVLLRVLLPTLITLLVVRVLAKLFGLSGYELVADAAEVAGISPYVGFVSQMGAFLWCAAVAICLFSVWAVRGRDKATRTWRSFFWASGLLTLVLLLDDAFQIHETYDQLFRFVGWDTSSLDHLQNAFELIFFLIYGALISLYGTRFRSVLKQTHVSILFVAIALFGLSIGVDQLPEHWYEHHTIEETFKILGIVAWLTYFAYTGRDYLRRSLGKT